MRNLLILPRTRSSGLNFLAAIFLAAGLFTTAEIRAELLDEEISLAIEQRLLSESGVRLPGIDVKVNGGTATLSGSVGHLLARERAGVIAESVRGVQTVLNNLVVKPGTRSAEEIRADFQASLKSDPVTDDAKVTAAVESGVLTLSGTVDSPVEKRLILSKAKALRGIVAVKDQLQVAVRENRSDAELAAEIRAALASDVWIEDRRLKVEVTQGKAVLSGEIGSAAQRSRARSLAWVPGVREVDAESVKVAPWMANEMRAQPRPNPTSAELRETIRQTLRRDPRVAALVIEIDVQGSTVTLSGIVGSAAAKWAAERIAQNTRGVSAVKSNLRLHPETPKPNANLEADVQAALARDVYLGGEKIDVSTGAGMVTLNGTVESQFQKQRAEAVASGVRGVVTIANALRVRTPAAPSFEEKVDPYLSDVYNPLVEDRPELRPATKPDLEIQQAIEREFRWSPFVNPKDLNVTVTNGIATLTGYVSSVHEMTAAVENAREGGAAGIRNNLHVR